MERADDKGDIPFRHPARHVAALGIALFVHGFLFAVFSFVPEKPLAIAPAPIPVKLVTTNIPVVPTVMEAPPSLPVPAPTPSEPKLPSTEPEPDIAPIETPTENTSLDPMSDAAPPISRPLSILSTDDPVQGEPIPDKWRLLDGARISLDKTQQPQNPNLEALSEALDCFGFDADCAVQRKIVFGEEQLSNTDLVWMRSYAHSGLSNSDFYGMSEAQIRERLGIPTAGKNGLMIIPGLAIDGPWWDALHGVNKACDYGVGINDQGQKQLVKSCAALKPSANDRIGFLPKTVE